MNTLYIRKRYSRRELLRLGLGSAAALCASSLLSSCAVDPVTGKLEIVFMSPAEEMRI